MKLTNAKHYLFMAICFAAILAPLSLKAQRMPQTRTFSQSQNTQATQPEITNENRQTMREIEMMREMLRDRRQQQDQQRQMLQELQQTISGGSDVSTTTTRTVPSSQSVQATTQHQPKYVTSESGLSQLEALEKLSKEQQKHDLEMQIAQREIELLKKQLNIANTQLDNCQGISAQLTSVPRQPQSLEQDFEPQQHKKTVRRQASQFERETVRQQVSEPQMSDENSRAMQEIEMMRDMLRERRQQQEQQRKLIQELQNSIN